jgi:hypothetical protein
MELVTEMYGGKFSLEDQFPVYFYVAPYENKAKFHFLLCRMAHESPFLVPKKSVRTLKWL